MSAPRTDKRPAGTGRLQSNEAGGFNGNSTGKVEGTQPLRYSRGSRATDSTPEQRTADTFADFLDAIAGDRGTGKGQQYICAPVGIAPDDELHRGRESFARAIGQPHRCKECVLPVDWLGLDADDGKDGCADLTPESFAALVAIVGKYSGIVYTTASHAPDKPRCRIVLELDQAAPRAERIRASQAVRARIDADMEAAGYGKVPWDPACDRPEQMLYLPVTKSDVYRLEGSALCLAELLAEVPPDAPPAPQDAHQGAPVCEPTAYALRALESAARAVRNAPPGDRNTIVNREAHGLGGFVPTGQLSRAVIEATLLAETAAWNPPDATPDKTRATIQAGIASGMARPRSDGMPPPPVDGQAGAKLEAVPLTNIMAMTESPVGYAMAPYYPRRLTTLLGGHGGIGKSMLALVHAAHVASGCRWGAFEVTQGRVVFLSFEDEGDIVRWRLRCIIEAYALPAEVVAANLTVLDGSDAETELAIESPDGAGLDFTPMMGLVSDAVRGADLVFIDNASDTYGGNENTRRQVRRFVRRLTREAKANNAAVVLLAHIDKGAARGGGKDNHYSGSTQWHNSVRSRLALVKSDEAGIELLHEKANHAAQAEPVALQRAEHGVLMPVSREALQAAQASAQALLAQSDSREVLEALRAAIESAPDGVPTATTGPRTTWHVLALLPEAPAWMKAKANKRRVEAALLALERAGAIEREARRTESRHTVQRWAMGPRALDEAA